MRDYNICLICGDSYDDCKCASFYNEENKYYKEEDVPYCGPKYRVHWYTTVELPHCETLEDFRYQMAVANWTLREQHANVGYYIVDKNFFDLFNEEHMRLAEDRKGYDKRPYQLDELPEHYIIKEIIVPLPKPKAKEDKETFVSRFMEKTKDDKTLTQKQRLAIAYKNWRERNKK